MLRRAVAEEAARLMIEHGVDDFGTAKRKAAARFGVTEHSVLPRNAEIESALADRQRLFGADRHTRDLQTLRRAALGAMRLLSRYHPRLVGPVLSGTATRHAEIELHLFADSVEAVVLTLIDAGIAHRLGERRFKPRSQRDEPLPYPAIRLQAAGHEVEATVFPEIGLRQAPVSPVDGRPMRRATIAEVESLLDGPRDQARSDSGT
jgi:hypothetical protein